MALARIKTWLAGDVLTAADLNAEFNNILNNPFPLINTMPSVAGDLFISTGVNTWGRLAIGTSGQVLQVSTGLVPVWGSALTTGATAVLAQFSSNTSVTNSTAETTLMTYTVSGNTIGSSGTIRVTGVGRWTLPVNSPTANTLTLRLYFGGTSGTLIASNTNGGDGSGVATSSAGISTLGLVSGDGATNAQDGALFQTWEVSSGNISKIPQILNNVGTAAIDTTANQAIVLTAQWSTALATLVYNHRHSFVERIV